MRRGNLVAHDLEPWTSTWVLGHGSWDSGDRPADLIADTFSIDVTLIPVCSTWHKNTAIRILPASSSSTAIPWN